MGTSFTWAGLVVVVLGGLGNYPGAFAGGLIVGLSEVLSASFFIPAMNQASAMVVFIAILLVKPEGLFGRPLRE